MDENEMERETSDRPKRDWRKYFIIGVSCAAILAVASGIALAVTVTGRDSGLALSAEQGVAPGGCHGSDVGQGFRGQGGGAGECDGECEKVRERPRDGRGDGECDGECEKVRERPRDGRGDGGGCGGEADCECGAGPEGN